MNELSVINELPSTGVQIEAFKKGCKAQILAGDVNPVRALVQLRTASKAIADLSSDDDIIEAAVKHFEKIGKKEIEVNGATVEKVETGVRYDYTVCNDPEWNQLYMDEQEIALKRKAREKFLQIVRPPEYNTQTGEVTLPRIPAVRTSKTNLKVTIR